MESVPGGEATFQSSLPNRRVLCGLGLDAQESPGLQAVSGQAAELPALLTQLESQASRSASSSHLIDSAEMVGEVALSTAMRLGAQELSAEPPPAHSSPSHN